MLPTTATLPDLRYPIGTFDYAIPTAAELETHLQTLAQLPQNLRQAVHGLTDAQLDTPYRPGGWTVRQVVHHLADSHLNSYIRFRFAVTEEQPTIIPYEENDWATLSDAATAPVELSLTLLDGLHARLVWLLRSLTQEQLQRTFIHPASGEIRIDQNIANYAWHSRHHLAHITHLRERMGW